MHMQFDFSQAILAAPDYSIVVGSQRWNLHVYGLNRIAGDWFVHLAAIGPGVRTSVIRVPALADTLVPAHEIVALTREWLAMPPQAGHEFFESPTYDVKRPA
jgi:hypothetical protein